MPEHDFHAQRLHVAADLTPGAEIVLEREAAHYVANVIRLGVGEDILLFNGRHGEWRATRIAGVRYAQVIIAVYIFSGFLAAVAGLLYVGLIKAPSLSLAVPLLLPSVAAAVIGGTSIFGGRGGYTGTIIGALILTVLATLLTILQMPEGSRRILFGLIILAVTAAYIRITEDS